MQRWVLHIDMDAFFASVEQLTRPTLRGRPVLVGGTTGRGVVAGASYEARVFGCHSAQPMSQAKALLPWNGVVVAGRHRVYRAASRRVFAHIRSRVPVIEQLSIDEAFMEPEELRGATPDAVTAWANTLRAEIRDQFGLPSSIGAGSGKQFAKIASGLAKPDGTHVIPHEDQQAMLGPLPVRELWGIGPVSGTRLKAMGVDTIADFAAMDPRDVEVALGRTIGPTLQALAQGHDDRPVHERAERKQISAEHTYPEDLTDSAQVTAAVRRAAAEAHRRLLSDGRAARTTTVKVKMADFRQITRSATLSYATDDFDVLLATAHRVTPSYRDTGPVRLIGVGFSGLEEARQGAMFPDLELASLRINSAATELDEDIETGVLNAPVTKPSDAAPDTAEALPTARKRRGAGEWRQTQDVVHSEFGHGWIQGAGHGVVSVRFETRSTGPGRTRTFDVDDPQLQPGDPLDSLDWDLTDEERG